MAFSPGYESWYLTWSIGSQLDGDAQSVLAMLDPKSGRITQRITTSDLAVGHSFLVYEPTNGHLVAYGGGVGVPVKFFDAETLDLEYEQPLGGSDSYVAAAAVADQRKEIYFGAGTREPAQIYVYDATEQAITHTLVLTDDPMLQRSAISDVTLSPDEQYLFVTTFLSPGGPGRFYMVNLERGEVLFEGRAGSYSNLAVSPNGHHVYIDCPAGGGRRQLPPTGQVLRFDTEAREMNVFIDGSEALGLGDYVLMADQITMLPSGEAFVIKNRAPALMKSKTNKDPTLLKVDAETGDVLATYVLPRDDRGYVTAWVRQLYLGVVPK